MAYRREFLKVAAAAATAVPAASRAGLGGRGALARIELHTVIADRRFPASRAFAARLAGSGAQLVSFEADITGLWLSHLQRLWAREPAAIAGLTARPALFLLERLAWDHRLRVVFHGEHVPAPGGRYTHALPGGGDLRVAELDAAGTFWTEALADALEGLPPARRSAGPTPAGMAAHPGESDEVLVSWVIAPLARKGASA